MNAICPPAIITYGAQLQAVTDQVGRPNTLKGGGVQPSPPNMKSIPDHIPTVIYTEDQEQ